MGVKNSSLTRVQPVVNGLLKLDATGERWLPRLVEMAASSRPTATTPLQIGGLLQEETPPPPRLGTVFERIVPPPTAFIRWLLEHPERMSVANPVSFGAKSANAIQWRRKLFAGSPEERRDARAEGVRQLERHGAKGSGRKWWAFEGFSHIDCCLITEKLVLFIEGKRTEALSASTRWFTQRSQLWRNVETAREFASGKEFAVILAVEGDEQGQEALAAADAALEGSYPHLAPNEREELANHFLGYTTWGAIVAEFGLPEACLIRTLSTPKLSAAP